MSDQHWLGTLFYSRNRRASSSSHESDKFHLHSYNLLVLLTLRKTRDFLSLDLAQLQLKMVLLARNQFNNNSCRYLILFVLHWQMTTTLFSPATGKFKISYVKDINIVLTNVEQGSFKLTSLLAVAGRDRSTWLNWIQMPSFLISLQRKRHRRLFIIYVRVYLWWSLFCKAQIKLKLIKGNLNILTSG